MVNATSLGEIGAKRVSLIKMSQKVLVRIRGKTIESKYIIVIRLIRHSSLLSWSVFEDEPFILPLI